MEIAIILTFYIYIITMIKRRRCGGASNSIYHNNTNNEYQTALIGQGGKSMSKKFTREFKRNYKKTSKAVDKWVMRNPGKAMALNAAGDCGLVAVGAAVAVRIMRKKQNPLAITTTEKKEGLISKIKDRFRKNPKTPAPEAATPTTETETSTEAPAPAES